jgi:hypothetical protein
MLRKKHWRKKIANKIIEQKIKEREEKGSRRVEHTFTPSKKTT